MDDKDNDSAIMIILLMIATSPSSSPASWFSRLTSRLTLLGFKPALNGNIRWYHAIYWISPLVIKRYDLADPSCHHLSPLISCPLPPLLHETKRNAAFKKKRAPGRSSWNPEEVAGLGELWHKLARRQGGRLAELAPNPIFRSRGLQGCDTLEPTSLGGWTRWSLRRMVMMTIYIL